MRLGVQKTKSNKGVISFNLFFLNMRITNNIAEIIIVSANGPSTPQPITGEHRCGPPRELKSIQTPIAELNPQVNQYLILIVLFC